MLEYGMTHSNKPEKYKNYDSVKNENNTVKYENSISKYRTDSEKYENYDLAEYENFRIQNSCSLKQPTVYYFLKENGISETYIKNLRKTAAAILLNGSPVNTRAKISDGDVLAIFKNPSPPTVTNLCDGDLEILFEDADFLIVNKPHNLVCTPTRSHYGMNLGGQICRHMASSDTNFVLRILNRLDRETAGIVVVAKNVLAYNSLTLNKIEKEYHAIASGNIYKNITINAPILTITRDGINEIRRVVSPDGKAAITHIEVVKNFCDTRCDNSFCHIKLRLETGRTHQIRVHLSSIGHPLLGDTLYSNRHNDTPQHTMLLLKRIHFQHFRTGKMVEIEVPFPPEWQNYV